MSTTGNDSISIRTYGKRSATKRKQGVQSELLKKQISPAGLTSNTRKRRRVSPELLARTPSPINTEEAGPSDLTAFMAQIPTVKVPYGSPRTMRPSSPQASPVKPTKPARDLSSIFDAITTPTSPMASPTKLVKRMLARSKTEPSLESQSTTQENIVDRTFSMPSIPSSPSRPRGSASNSASTLLPILPLAQKSSTTRTYAGKFRSFLVTLPSSSTPNSQTLEEEEGFDTRESYNSLRTRWGVDNSEDDPYPYTSPTPKSNSATPNISPSRNGRGKSKPPTTSSLPIPYAGMSNPLKSISELRNKGESRRFLDDLGYLFEGMDKNGGIGLRRTSALEIATKLCDADFARKVKAADFFSRTWDLFLEAGAGKGEDKILDILMVFFVALVSRDPISLAELAQRPPLTHSSPSISSKRKSKDNEDSSFVGTLFNVLENMTPDVDPLILVASQPGAGDSDLRKAGIIKKDRSMLTTVYKTITSKSKLFSSNTPISVSLIITHTLQLLPSSLIPTNHLSTFLKSLRLSFAPTPGTSLFSSLALRWSDAAQAVPYQSIYYHLRLLDAFLLDQWQSTLGDSSQSSQEVDVWKEVNDEEMKNAREIWLADDLIAFGVCTEIHELDKESDDTFLTTRCLDITLRVLVSLTHGDKRWGRKVIEGDYTMGLLMRTIYTAARELQLNESQGKKEETGVKREEKKEGTLVEDEEQPKNWRANSQALDTLCLALGLLTNLVQIAKSAKRVIRDTRLNPSCGVNKRACARKCVCSHRSSAIKILGDIYAQQQVECEASGGFLSEDSIEAHAEAEAAFLRGHLAVLFGLLMMDCPENQFEILAALPSPNAKMAKSAKQTKLSRLVDQAKDFAAFYTVVSNAIGGEKESKIANEVVHYLEVERDAVI